jgi:hypothetical protein
MPAGTSLCGGPARPLVDGSAFTDSCDLSGGGASRGGSRPGPRRTPWRGPNRSPRPQRAQSSSPCPPGCTQDRTRSRSAWVSWRESARTWPGGPAGQPGCPWRHADETWPLSWVPNPGPLAALLRQFPLLPPRARIITSRGASHKQARVVLDTGSKPSPLAAPTRAPPGGHHGDHPAPVVECAGSSG